MLPNYSFYFDGYDISSITGVTVYNYNLNISPGRDVKTNKIARADGAVTTGATYNEKNIPAFMEICGSNRGDTETIIAEVKSRLQGINKVLKASQYGQDISFQRTYLNEFNVEWDGATAIVEAVFVAADPIGRATALTNLFNDTNVTTQAIDLPVTIGGSYYAKPIFTIILTDITNGTGASVTVRNSSTGQGVTVTRDWVDGDTLSIDSANHLITVNGGKVDFTGVFPRYPVGSNAIGWVDTFSARDVSFTVDYYKTFI